MVGVIFVVRRRRSSADYLADPYAATPLYAMPHSTTGAPLLSGDTLGRSHYADPNVAGGRRFESLYAHQSNDAATQHDFGLDPLSVASSEQAQVLVDFCAPDIPDTLVLSAGQVVAVLERCGIHFHYGISSFCFTFFPFFFASPRTNEEWWDCQSPDGVVGFVPCSVLMPLKKLPKPAAKKTYRRSQWAAKPVPRPPIQHQGSANDDVNPLLAQHHDGTEIPDDDAEPQPAAAVQPAYLRKPAPRPPGLSSSSTSGTAAVPLPPLPSPPSAASSKPQKRSHAPRPSKKNLQPLPLDDLDEFETGVMVADVAEFTAPSLAAPAKPAPKPPISKVSPRPKKAAPIPGRPFTALYDYTPNAEGAIALRVGDDVVAPAGTPQEDPEWMVVFNRDSGETGWVPRAWLK